MLLKLGVDTRHKRATEDFMGEWNKSNPSLDLTPRRVLEGNKVLAKDLITGMYWLLWKERWSVSGYEIDYGQAQDYIFEAKENPPAYAKGFKNPRLYATT